MRTLVYGAGPLGSYYAARLHEAGVDVALLARGRRLTDLGAHGVVLENARTGARETHAVPVVEALGADDDYDLVLVVMRKDRAQEILPTLAANRHIPTVLFLQNNPAGFETYTAALGAGRVLAGFPVMGGQRLDPVMRVLPFGAVPMPIGEPDGSIGDRTRAVAVHLERMRGQRVQIRRDMDAWLVTHVAALLIFFGLYAVEVDVERFAGSRDARLLGVRAQREAVRAQRAAGIPLTPWWTHGVRVLAEPLAVAQLRALTGTTVFEVGVAAHARVAREEISHILHEYRARVAPGGAATPTLDRVIEHVDHVVPPFPPDSRDEPLRWGGVAALVALAVAPLAARRAVRRAVRRD
jgi:2-dehydropantoate 2-reductase